MQLYSKFDDALNNLHNRYLNSKTEKKFYIFICKIERREFYTVMSFDETKQQKVSIKKAAYCLGGSDRVKKLRNEYQERINSDTAKKQKAYYQYLRAAKKEAALRGKLLEMQKQEEKK